MSNNWYEKRKINQSHVLYERLTNKLLNQKFNILKEMKGDDLVKRLRDAVTNTGGVPVSRITPEVFLRDLDAVIANRANTITNIMMAERLKMLLSNNKKAQLWLDAHAQAVTNGDAGTISKLFREPETIIPELKSSGYIEPEPLPEYPGAKPGEPEFMGPVSPKSQEPETPAPRAEEPIAIDASSSLQEISANLDKLLNLTPKNTIFHSNAEKFIESTKQLFRQGVNKQINSVQMKLAVDSFINQIKNDADREMVRNWVNSYPPYINFDNYMFLKSREITRTKKSYESGRGIDPLGWLRRNKKKSITVIVLLISTTILGIIKRNRDNKIEAAKEIFNRCKDTKGQFFLQNTNLCKTAAEVIQKINEEEEKTKEKELKEKLDSLKASIIETEKETPITTQEANSVVQAASDATTTTASQEKPAKLTPQTAPDGTKGEITFSQGTYPVEKTNGTWIYSTSQSKAVVSPVDLDKIKIK